MPNAIDHLPVDVWHEVLELVVNIPDLLQDFSVPDPGWLWRNERAYWNSERQRGKLRLVCRLWKIIVDEYAHQLLHLWDFAVGEYPTTVLQKALRVVVRLPNPCGCWVTHRYTAECKSDGKQLWLKPKDTGDRKPTDAEWRQFHEDLLLKILSDQFALLTFSKMRTLEIKLFQFYFPSDELTSFISHSRISCLRITAWMAPWDASLIANALPSLKELHLDRCGSVEEEDSRNISASIPRFPSLLRLSLIGRTRWFEDMRLSAWRLPELRTLKLSPPESLVKEFVGWKLPLIHKNIISIAVDLDVITTGFWEAFSNLKSIHITTSYPLKQIEPPSQSHPLSILVLSPSNSIYTDAHYFMQSFEREFECIRIDTQWDVLCHDIQVPCGNYWGNMMYGLEQLHQEGISILDRDGIEWNACFISLWRRHSATLDEFRRRDRSWRVSSMVCTSTDCNVTGL